MDLSIEALIPLALQALNGITLVGAIGVKAPQIIKIASARSVAGLNEQSLVMEWVANVLLAVYNLLKGATQQCGPHFFRKLTNESLLEIQIKALI